MNYLEARTGSATLRWPLPAGSSTIGRAPTCTISIDDVSISRQHLAVQCGPSGVSLTDLGSTNGLHVGGERVREARVEIDEWFVVGTVMFVVRDGISWMTGDAPVPVDGVAASGGERSDRTAPLVERPPGPLVDRDPEEPRARPQTLQNSADRVAGGQSAPSTASHEPAVAEFANMLAAALSAASSSDEATSALVDLARHWSGGAGACIVGHHGNGWSLEASAGEIPAGEDIIDLVRPTVDSAGDDVRSAPGLAAIRISGTTWLVVRSESRPSAIDPLRLFAELARWIRAWPRTPSVDGGETPPLSAASEDSPARPRRAGTQAIASGGSTFIGASAARASILAEVARFAPVDLPVLVTGESGSGKELIARLLHAHSRRADGPFVAINCAALPSELLEAELFGIEKNVATGVSARAGHFRQAHGGTLFLDEIADLPAPLQPKLLRALECGAVTPLGAPLPIPVDVRLVAATNAAVDGPRGLSESGRLRSDLFYRLAGATLHIPPLRERTEDILPLARHFAREAAVRQGRGFRGIDLDAARLLLGYRWPGNVRELRHAMHRAVALADGTLLHAALLPPAVRNESDARLGGVLLPGIASAGSAPGTGSGAGADTGVSTGTGTGTGTGASARASASTGNVPAPTDYFSSRDAFDRHYFTALLERSGGNLSEAARLAGMSRSHLYTRLAELGLK